MNVLEIIRFFDLKQVYCVLVEDMVDISTQITSDAKDALHASIVVWFCSYPRHTSPDTKYYRLAFTDQGTLLFSQADDCLIFPSKEERTWENLHNEMIQQQKSNGMENILKIIIEHKIEKVYCPLLGETILIKVLSDQDIKATVYFIESEPKEENSIEGCFKSLYFDAFGRLKGIDEAYRDASKATCAIFPSKIERSWKRYRKRKKLMETDRSTSLLEDETDLLELSL